MNAGAAFLEGGIEEQLLVQRDIGFDAGDGHFRQRDAHARHRLVAGIAVGNQFTHHRIVMRRHGIALVDVRIDADARAAGRMVALDLARRRHEGERVFGVDATLHGVAAEVDVLLLETQRQAGGDADLFLHDVDAGDQLGHRMLHLQTGVHFKEVEALMEQL